MKPLKVYSVFTLLMVSSRHFSNFIETTLGKVSKVPQILHLFVSHHFLDQSRFKPSCNISHKKAMSSVVKGPLVLSTTVYQFPICDFIQKAWRCGVSCLHLSKCTNTCTVLLIQVRKKSIFRCRYVLGVSKKLEFWENWKQEVVFKQTFYKYIFGSQVLEIDPK